MRSNHALRARDGNGGPGWCAVALLATAFLLLWEAGAVQAAAERLVGEHDFASFAASSSSPRQSTVRTLKRCEVFKKFHWIYIDMEADGFLYHMVRNIVGTLVEIGRRHWPVEKITEILAARNRTAAGPMAPPNGLTLVWVKY